MGAWEILYLLLILLSSFWCNYLFSIRCRWEVAYVMKSSIHWSVSKKKKLLQLLKMRESEEKVRIFFCCSSKQRRKLSSKIAMEHVAHNNFMTTKSEDVTFACFNNLALLQAYSFVTFFSFFLSSSEKRFAVKIRRFEFRKEKFHGEKNYSLGERISKTIKSKMEIVPNSWKMWKLFRRAIQGRNPSFLKQNSFLLSVTQVKIF